MRLVAGIPVDVVMKVFSLLICTEYTGNPDLFTFDYTRMIFAGARLAVNPGAQPEEKITACNLYLKIITWRR
jgi:hypothetical protein